MSCSPELGGERQDVLDRGEQGQRDVAHVAGPRRRRPWRPAPSTWPARAPRRRARRRSAGRARRPAPPRSRGRSRRSAGRCPAGARRSSSVSGCRASAPEPQPHALVELAGRLAGEGRGRGSPRARRAGWPPATRRGRPSSRSCPSRRRRRRRAAGPAGAATTRACSGDGA